MYSAVYIIKIFSPDLQLETLLKALTYQLNFAFKLRLALILQKGEPCCEDIVFVDVPCKPPLGF